MSKLTIAKIEAKSQNELTQAVLTYKELKAKIAFLEAELKAPKAVIEAACEKTADGSIITEDFKVSLSIQERETFSLKNAKAVLGEEALKPFISKTVYSTLRVS